MSAIPFDEASGDRLRSWVGIDNPTFFDATQLAILPMGFCFPGTGKSGDLPPRPQCEATWRARLLAAMPAIELTLMIGLPNGARRSGVCELCRVAMHVQVGDINLSLGK